LQKYIIEKYAVDSKGKISCSKISCGSIVYIYALYLLDISFKSRFIPNDADKHARLL